MTTTADIPGEATKALLEKALGTADWLVQYGRWVPNGEPAQRYAVVRPVGGGSRTFVRNPILTVLFIGGEVDAPGVVRRAVEAFIELVIGVPNQPQKIPGLASMETSEPTFSQTADGRVTFETVITCTLSL